MIAIIIVLSVVVVVLWLVNTYIPMAQPIKTIFNVLVIIVVLLWILSTFGLIGNVPKVRL